mgnify:CR=1 FL=1
MLLTVGLTTAVLGFYLDAVHALGAELSISTEHAAVDDAVLALAEASGDTAASRKQRNQDRALSGQIHVKSSIYETVSTPRHRQRTR